MNTTFNSSKPLANKQAIIFGASGDVGAAVAREFAAQGARVFLSGRRLEAVKQIAQEIRQDGGEAHAAEVDARDEKAVTDYLDILRQEEGSIDIVLNLASPQPKEYGNGTPTLELPLEQFILPFSTIVPSQFITARAAARHMVEQHSGVILFVIAPLVHNDAVNVSAIGSAFGAMEALTKLLAKDLGPNGVRVACIEAGPMLDTRTIQYGIERTMQVQGISREQILSRYEQATLLKRVPTTVDTARTAAFLASDAARMITGVVVNVTSGRS